MQDIKTIISITAIILTFIGYIPYLRDTLQGKTTPHVYTWFIWGFVTAIAFGLQVEGGAGVGSWVTIVVAIICFTNTIFFVLSFVALFLWLIAKQPVLSVILTSTIDLLGFAPTVRKSWNKPHSETLFTYELSTLRHGLSILALQQYSIVTWLYPVSWTFANALFSLILIIRRKQVNK
ncbi:MAG: hypothetical protein US99_C0048G0007 [Candidatus Daviesbacteria bacterium GW2011_GWF2_38_6]|uniref:Uncharacterized protein n=1 Tax=Candidatus Daviesbacteria bacterium GW2011_GWF2_38_6 TaxID=1618432 RepID=A0A0G0NJ75_9BACT|nr:MAG: hypothetical protein US99_C0048G0007 [Candidatus Daviesbacteria bacterium GW2011_GWF2_38_6]